MLIVYYETSWNQFEKIPIFFNCSKRRWPHLDMYKIFRTFERKQSNAICRKSDGGNCTVEFFSAKIWAFFQGDKKIPWESDAFKSLVRYSVITGRGLATTICAMPSFPFAWDQKFGTANMISCSFTGKRQKRSTDAAEMVLKDSAGFSQFWNLDTYLLYSSWSVVCVCARVCARVCVCVCVCVWVSERKCEWGTKS